MPELIAVPAVGGPHFVTTLLDVWDAGHALLPVDPRLPPPARHALLEAMAPSMVLDEDGEVVERRDGRPTDEGDALVVPTSGSTGQPKGVVLAHEAVGASARAVNEALEVDGATDGWLCCLPLSHVAGLAVITRALAAGSRLEVLPHFDPRVVEAAARERGATIATLVPTAMARTDVSGFRRVVVGGAAPPAVLPPNASVSYGMTETGSAVVMDGRPVPGAEVRIVDGEVQVRGPMLLRCYRDGTDPRDAEGWLATGDAGELDDDGRLVVHGRRGELIITGGENVWPVAVETVLATHPAVAEVAVVGRPDETWGQAVTAVVVPADPSVPPTLEDLRATAKAELPAYAAPHRLELVDALPRTALGKVRRHEIGS